MVVVLGVLVEETRWSLVALGVLVEETRWCLVALGVLVEEMRWSLVALGVLVEEMRWCLVALGVLVFGRLVPLRETLFPDFHLRELLQRSVYKVASDLVYKVEL